MVFSPTFLPLMNAMQPAQQEQDSFIPMDYMSMLAGIPSMSFDSMGRYGISEDQRVNAMQQGFANVLGGASQSFITGNPMPAMQAGGQVGQFIDQKLDAYSNTNLKNELASLDNKIKKLQAFGLMSDLEKGQVALEGAKIDLDNKKLMTEAASKAVEAYSPVIDTMATIAENSLGGADPKARQAVRDSILAQGSAALAEIRRGNIQQGTAAINQLFDKYGALDEGILKASIASVTNKQIGLIGAMPEKIAALEKVAGLLGEGSTVEIGKDGEPYIMTKWDHLLRDLEINKAKASIRASNASALANEALADYRKNPPPSSGANRMFGEDAEQTYRQLNEAIATVQSLGAAKVTTKDQKKKLEEANEVLSEFNLLGNQAFLNDWNKATEEQKVQWVMRQLKLARGVPLE